jgi:hypothetical protein
LRLLLPLPFDDELERFADPRLLPLDEPRLRLEEPLLLRLDERLRPPPEDEPDLAVEAEPPLALEEEEEDLRLDDEPPLDFDDEVLRLDDEPPPLDLDDDDLPPDDERVALEDDPRLLARERDEDCLPPDELDEEDLTLPSSITPRHAPVSSSSISTYALYRARSARTARLTWRIPRAAFSISESG